MRGYRFGRRLGTRWEVLGLASALGALVLLAGCSREQGTASRRIKIGNIVPYSGPASAYGVYGKVEAAYFRMVNESGGINGRRIDFITVDGALSPPKTVEMARRLVERDQVLVLFGVVGTAPNSAIRQYLHDRKVPHLFVSSGASLWNDPRRYPWSMALNLPYQIEARAYARHILAHTPSARIGVLYQNDDYGKDYLDGLRAGLGSQSSLIVAALSYEVSAPSVDSQIVQLRASGADVFVNFSSPKFAAQAIRKAYDIGWKPVQYLNSISRSVGSVLVPAGREKAAGIISAAYLKDPTDPQFAPDPAVAEWTTFMRRHCPQESLDDAYCVYGYFAAQALIEVLRRAGEDLSRDNIMRQAASLQRLQLPMALPGITLETSPTDYAPIESMRLMRFDGTQWVLFGDVIGR